MEVEAQGSLAADASFLEILQCLKWQIDSDARVKAGMCALRDRGLKVLSSFAPRIRVRLFAGETVLALPGSGAESKDLDGEDFGYVNKTVAAPLVQEVRDAASAVVVLSPHSRQLREIANEAMQANFKFERIAADVERAGYQVHICLDLSAYVNVRDSAPTPALPYGSQISRGKKEGRSPADAGLSSRLALSGLDLAFLKQLRIRSD